ncbi:MAG TPA: pH regulation protein F, partial [Alphaproteobacteria bacterium]|nr:pH regulation protein F [Alphaproteobacteria bacterium]
TKTVLLIAVIGFLTGRPDFVDIALVYALINFIGTVAILKVIRYRALGDVSPQDGVGD